MPIPKSPDLHGSAPDTSDAALLIIDMLNPMEFDGSEKLLPAAVRAAECVAELKERCVKAKIPVIYVNDNFGRWRSNLNGIVEYCVRREVAGHPVARLLAPSEVDYFVLKPKHSGFFATNLEILLTHLGAEKLILTGVAGNICVLFTAHDAHMRDYRLWVPSDCVASNSAGDNRFALHQMKRVMNADIRPSTELRLPLNPSRSRARPSRAKASRESRSERRM